MESKSRRVSRYHIHHMMNFIGEKKLSSIRDNRGNELIILSENLLLPMLNNFKPEAIARCIFDF